MDSLYSTAMMMMTDSEETETIINEEDEDVLSIRISNSKDDEMEMREFHSDINDNKIEGRLTIRDDDYINENQRELRIQKMKERKTRENKILESRIDYKDPKYNKLIIVLISLGIISSLAFYITNLVLFYKGISY